MSYASTRVDRERSAYESLSSALNDMSSEGDAFVEAFLNEHRTLQQKAVAMMLTCLVRLADAHESGRYDLRNEASVEIAAAIRDLLNERDVLIRDGVVRLPFI